MTDYSKEAQQVLDSLYSYVEGYPADSLSKEAISWLYSVAYAEFRKDAERQIANESS